jgi:hypothetical protein
VGQRLWPRSAENPADTACGWRWDSWACPSPSDRDKRELGPHGHRLETITAKA